MLNKIFSTQKDGKHQVINIFGFKIKYKPKYTQKMLEELLLYARRENPSKDLDVQPAQNLKLCMARIAADESAKFIMKNCITAPTFKSRKALLTYALSQVNVEGKYMEFGVYNGNSINHIAKQKSNEIIYGFDSFEGLPETWQTYYGKGHFKLDNLPNVEKNVMLIKGWFDESLPKFIEEQGEFKVAFINNDSDLYSSTKTTLDCLKKYMQEGTIIVFDEFLNYPGWENNEFKAFHEFLDETGFKCEYIGYVPTAKQMAVKLYR